MELYGDYHTHTVYSHGKGSIEDSVLQAARIGLREIAVTDHGFNHLAYGVRRREIPRMRAELDFLKKKYPSVKTYLGVEADILGRSGRIDVRAEDKQYLDIIVCGYHKFIGGGSPAYFLSNNLGLSGSRTVTRNTDAYLAAIERNRIDVLSHPGNYCKCDVREVARACKYFKTYFELNGKRIFLTDAELEAAAKEDCEFILSSDAHSPKRVGDVAAALSRAEKIGIDVSKIANYGRVPQFKNVRRADGESR